MVAVIVLQVFQKSNTGHHWLRGGHEDIVRWHSSGQDVCVHDHERDRDPSHDDVHHGSWGAGGRAEEIDRNNSEWYFERVYFNQHHLYVFCEIKYNTIFMVVESIPNITLH